ncbi:serine/arginine repetitive matrix protein 2 [Sinocyclocheilus grahami]|uniref:serine/arginine repetitive matrix protein 2 n=1 Tax=Sinocyclocheilus grahami TaxID=75366 RepID=UPI0007AD2509|nr:PREDICTED: proline and serine-rich protein 2 [Sinocyclocheilus grahami]
MQKADGDLQFLSLEERECILFFEETIGSLEEDDERTGISAGERPDSYARHPSPVDQDIIDLVHPTAHPSTQRDTLPVMPDFQELIIPPETHFELKPKRDRDVPDGPQEEFGHQPPAGSVPTPVVIASKIAEHQGATGTSASQLLQRRCSLESPPNPSAKHGPPTHAKPTRVPDSISMLRSSREHIPHSIATEAVSVQERRAQMLANLSGPAHPLDGGEPACVRNLPMRSISFRDPTPDKSRMEALSKLGLAQRRAQSVMHSENVKTGTTFNIPNPANASTIDTTDHRQTKSSPAPTLTSAEVTHSDFNSYGGSNRMEALSKVGLTQRQSVMHSSPRDLESAKTGTTFNTTNPANASGDVRTIDTTDHRQTKSSPAPTLTSAEVTHSDFNSYGGKSITLNPTTSFRSECVSSSLPKTESSEIQINNFGGRSRVMTPSQPNHRTQTKTITPVKEENTSSNRTSNEDLPKRKALHPEAPVKQPPAPASKPSRHQSLLSPARSRPAPLSPELRRKSLPKPSFRTQGVTVQFSGRGATDEARRDALRKLGLLRNTS